MITIICYATLSWAVGAWILVKFLLVIGIVLVPVFKLVPGSNYQVAKMSWAEIFDEWWTAFMNPGLRPLAAGVVIGLLVGVHRAFDGKSREDMERKFRILFRRKATTPVVQNGKMSEQQKQATATEPQSGQPTEREFREFSKDRNACRLFEQAKDLFEKKNFPESLDILRTLLDTYPDEPMLIYSYGVALASSGQIERAFSIHKDLVSRREWQRASDLKRGLEEIEKRRKAPANAPGNAPIAVQSEPATGANDPKARFVDRGDGTVVDNKTKLMWQKGDDGERRTFREAEAYCKGLQLGGFLDWRLPSIDELLNVARDWRNVFAAPKDDEPYWSSTVLRNPYPQASEDQKYAAKVMSSSGETNQYFIVYHYYTRAVRTATDHVPKDVRRSPDEGEDNSHKATGKLRVILQQVQSIGHLKTDSD